MSGLLDKVDLRTQLAGHNRLELLLFRLGGRQRFGINVFKVREVIQCPALTRMPNAHAVVRGVAHLRGKTMSVIDLAHALGKKPVVVSPECFVIITEYNRTVQGFLIQGVDRIVNMKWEAVRPAPSGLGAGSYLTAVTQVDDELVEVIDVEKILADMGEVTTDISAALKAAAPTPTPRHILVVDDSSVARKQIARTLDQLGIEYFMAANGREALELLQTWARDPHPVTERLAMVITDIEMPEMDGYTLTAEIKKDRRLAPLFVLLHSSLSGVFNRAMVEKVGANEFLAKYHPDELAAMVLKILDAEGRRSVAA